MPREYGRNYQSRAAYLQQQRLIDAQLKKDLERRRYLRVVRDAMTTTYYRRVKQQTFNVSLSAISNINQTVVGATADWMREMNVMLTAQTGSRFLGSDLEEIYEEIGLRAQRSVVAAYAQRNPRRDLPAYRTTARSERNKRYANGTLLRALGSPDFFEATPKGLKFINEDRLDLEAKHWRRLNFGTHGGARIAPPRRFELNWDGLIVAALGLEPDVRPAFRIPPGVWVQPGVFYPSGEVTPEVTSRGVIGRTGNTTRRNGQRTKSGTPVRIRRREYGMMTRGIPSTNFLDAGVRRIAREMPWAFERLGTLASNPPPQIRRKIQVRVPVNMGTRLRGSYRAGGFDFPEQGKPYPR